MCLKRSKITNIVFGMTPAGVRELLLHGHRVLVEKDGGKGVGFENREYQKAGAVIKSKGSEIFSEADLIVKVKELQPQECKLLQPGQGIFTFLHLAPDPEQTKMLLDANIIAIAYETVTAADNSLPLLAPMSEVAGRMSIQAGAHVLEKAQGGSGTLLGGVPGVSPGKVMILGGGVVGSNAARMAIGLGADVTILDRSINRLHELDQIFTGRVKTLYSTQETIEECLRQADLVIGAVLIPGGAAPKLVTRKMLSIMKRGSVLVDVAIDQGGCFETSRPTTHQEPTFIEEGIVHYCVTNMPGAVARTSTFALTNATLPYLLEIANKGFERALMENSHLGKGLNIYHNVVTHPAVAKALGYEYVPLVEALKKQA